MVCTNIISNWEVCKMNGITLRKLHEQIGNLLDTVGNDLVYDEDNPEFYVTGVKYDSDKDKFFLQYEGE